MANTISDIASVYTYKQEVKRAETAKSPASQPSNAVDARAPIERSAESARSAEKADNSQSLAKQVEAFSSRIGRNLEFSVDKDTGKQVVRVIASDTGELVRQIPSDQMLHIIEQAQDLLGSAQVGVFLDDKS